MAIDRSDRPRLSRLRREAREKKRRCDRLILAFFIGFTLMLLAPQPAHPHEVGRYSCHWVAEQRKIYSDAELRQKAKELRLPPIVVRMAERCPK